MAAIGIAFTALLAFLFIFDTAKDFQSKPELAIVIENVKKLSPIRNEDKKENLNIVNCSNLKELWRPDENVYFDGNKIKLKDGAMAGSIIYKDKVSSFLNIELVFRSILSSGVNTNLAFENNDGELKYAIGDGDFKTIRYFYNDHRVLTPRDIKETFLDSNINNSENIGFKLNIIEQKGSNKAVSSLTYTNVDGKNNPINLEDIIITNPQKLYLSMGFGLDAHKESENKNAYIEVISCSLLEELPSKILN